MSVQTCGDEPSGVYNGRRVLRWLSGDDVSEADRRVLLMCETCGRLAEVTRRAMEGSGCPSCSKREVGAARLPANGTRELTEAEQLLEEAGRICPELWRNGTEEDRETVMEAMAELTAVMARFTGQPMRTLEEVAMLEGVSRERVRQMEQVAFKKVRLKGGAALREHAEHIDDRSSGWTYPEGV